jgi:two-component system chemotaxis response regulator CheY
MTTKTILVVDDSSTMRAIIKMNLKHIPDVTVVEACHGRDALAKLKVGHVDLVLTDVNMPEMDGLTFVAELRKTTSKTVLPVIIISTKGEERDVVKGISLGANDYVPKPINGPALTEKVRWFLTAETKSTRAPAAGRSYATLH